MRASSHHSHRSGQNRVRGWREYAPLVVVVTLAFLAAAAKQVHYAAGWAGREWMLDGMGFFFVMFSMFKLFDLSGFADGFHMYDLLAQRVRGYGFVYPFIELALGLGYLARWRLPVVQGATIAIMVFGGLGVLNALRKKLDVDCACLGTVLRLPLSTVALTEDLGMAAMAALMWPR